MNAVVIPAAAKLNFSGSVFGFTKEAVLAILHDVADAISVITASPKYVAATPGPLTVSYTHLTLPTKA